MAAFFLGKGASPVSRRHGDLDLDLDLDLDPDADPRFQPRPRHADATGQGYIPSVAVDGSNVYWAGRDKGCSNQSTKLASGQAAPGPLIVDTTTLYWANAGHGGPDGQIVRVDL